MEKIAGESAARFQVVCAWCGDVIRRDSTKPSQRTCARCFSQMMNAHARPRQQGAARGASER